MTATHMCDNCSCIDQYGHQVSSIEDMQLITDPSAINALTTRCAKCRRYLQDLLSRGLVRYMKKRTEGCRTCKGTGRAIILGREYPNCIMDDCEGGKVQVQYRPHDYILVDVDRPDLIACHRCGLLPEADEAYPFCAGHHHGGFRSHPDRIDGE